MLRDQALEVEVPVGPRHVVGHPRDERRDAGPLGPLGAAGAVAVGPDGEHPERRRRPSAEASMRAWRLLPEPETRTTSPSGCGAALTGAAATRRGARRRGPRGPARASSARNSRPVGAPTAESRNWPAEPPATTSSTAEGEGGDGAGRQGDGGLGAQPGQPGDLAQGPPGDEGADGDDDEHRQRGEPREVAGLRQRGEHGHHRQQPAVGPGPGRPSRPRRPGTRAGQERHRPQGEVAAARATWASGEHDATEPAAPRPRSRSSVTSAQDSATTPRTSGEAERRAARRHRARPGTHRAAHGVRQPRQPEPRPEDVGVVEGHGAQREGEAPAAARRPAGTTSESGVTRNGPATVRAAAAGDGDGIPGPPRAERRGERTRQQAPPVLAVGGDVDHRLARAEPRDDRRAGPGRAAARARCATSPTPGARPTRAARGRRRCRRPASRCRWRAGRAARRARPGRATRASDAEPGDAPRRARRAGHRRRRHPDRRARPSRDPPGRVVGTRAGRNGGGR